MDLLNLQMDIVGALKVPYFHDIYEVKYPQGFVSTRGPNFGV